MNSITRWPLVWAIILAGVIAAFQIGKASIAVPLLREDLGLSLTLASWVISIYALLGATAGLPAGIGIRYLGARRAVVGGLLMIGVASCAGAFATGGLVLMVTRVFEGLGFLIVVIAAPTLLRMVTATKDNDIVFGCWTTYYAGGSAIVMLAAPLLADYGWQGIWLATGLIAFGYGIVVWLISRDTVETYDSRQSPLADVGVVLRSPGPLLLAVTFLCYSLQYHALSGLMPTLLVERLGLSIAQAGVITAGAIVANGVGAALAGVLSRIGIPLWLMVAICFGFSGLASYGIFAQSMPVTGVALLGAASLGLTGLLPALIYVGAPRFTPNPALLVLSLGIIVQASHLGHFIGPAALGTWVENLGWSSAPGLFTLVALLGIAGAFGLRGITRRAAERKPG